MKVQTEIMIKAPAEKVWGIITDIDGSADFISGIENIDVLERPATGIIGLKWQETRTMFGQTATEIMWITDAVENEYYKVRAENHGVIYFTDFYITNVDGQSNLRMDFTGETQTFFARLMSAVTGIFFKKATKDALLQDLEDIKAAAEKA